ALTRIGNEVAGVRARVRLDAKARAVIRKDARELCEHDGCNGHRLIHRTRTTIPLLWCSQHYSFGSKRPGERSDVGEMLYELPSVFLMLEELSLRPSEEHGLKGRNLESVIAQSKRVIPGRANSSPFPVRPHSRGSDFDASYTALVQ